MDDLADLDSAAEHQLKHSDLAEYYRYKEALMKEGEVDIREILTGFIWGCLEEDD